MRYADMTQIVMAPMEHVDVLAAALRPAPGARFGDQSRIEVGRRI